jgi:hypothetical protein
MIIQVATLITAFGTIGGVITAIIVFLKKLANAQRCQLRSEMLKIYYRNCESETIHQYEFENFSMLYDAYKALKGNSFIDKIWKEIKGWEITTRRECTE